MPPVVVTPDKQPSSRAHLSSSSGKPRRSASRAAPAIGARQTHIIRATFRIGDIRKCANRQRPGCQRPYLFPPCGSVGNRAGPDRSRSIAARAKPTSISCVASNLDHGTDFAIFVDDMPVNMRTHAHGQGYADHQFSYSGIDRLRRHQERALLPPTDGDFSSVGSAHINLVDGPARIGGGIDGLRDCRQLRLSTFARRPHRNRSEMAIC